MMEACANNFKRVLLELGGAKGVQVFPGCFVGVLGATCRGVHLFQLPVTVPHGTQRYRV